MTRERTVMSHEDEYQRMPDILAGLVGEAIRLEARNLEARKLLEEWLSCRASFGPTPLAERTAAWLSVKLCEPVECHPHDGRRRPLVPPRRHHSPLCLCDSCNPF